jgi:hypothetical protein
MSITCVQMIPGWCQAFLECWEVVVNKWLLDEWLKAHNAVRERRLMMEGPAHHQGSHSLPAYMAAYVRDLF